jgi:Domain of unknown function (DUF4349)
MSRRFLVLSCAVICMMAGCSYAKRGSSFSGYSGSSKMAVAFAASPQRYVAERHKLDIITPESDLQKAWESTIAHCATIKCELVSSSITTRTEESAPAGMISLRVVPDDVNNLLAFVEKLGKIAQHTTEREDKTTQVVDTEAKIKNLTAFRDNLRTMLAKQTATVKDLVEIQKQLTDTQSELDSETTQRKILANETDKIAVEISFRVERRDTHAGGFAQIWNALRGSGSILADSTASLITTIVTIIPWLLLIVPLGWLLGKGWKKLRLRRSGAVSPPSSSAGPS